MNDSPKGPDYAKSLYLPETGFPMRAGLPEREPEFLRRWAMIGLDEKMRATAIGRPKFTLHDGPPYANGNIHIGHALNKILKDLVTRSQRMTGKDCVYVPGWDCHGLPIEWKIEEENYRAKGKKKPDFAHPEEMVAFRRECRAYAEKWLDVQREEFKRLGVAGEWDHPYATMAYPAEATIAREIMKFAENGLLYRGSKPVMWSVVEKTALAEAEVEYEDHTSDMVWVAFPIKGRWSNDTIVPVAGQLQNCSVVIWTTTPWTLPGNRAISFSKNILYGVYEIVAVDPTATVVPGKRLIVAEELQGRSDNLIAQMMRAAKVTEWREVKLEDENNSSHRIYANSLDGLVVSHPLAHLGYDFNIPLFDGDHVTDDTGTGFVHTAPGHGREDFDIWMANQRDLIARGIDTRIPYTVDEDGFYTKDAPGFEGKRVLTEKGEKGDANEAVIAELIKAGNLVARGRLKHQYPHSWRSKKPVIFRNTPQWFIAMDKPFADGKSLREIALDEIARTQWTPAAGENRIRGMIANRPDWVVSRQRAWGVPIAVFVKKGTHEILVDAKVNARIIAAFEEEGADAWYEAGAAARFLAPDYHPDDYEKISDVLDVWFDSGSTHAFVLDDPRQFPALAGIHRKRDGGRDEVMYLEGSDQHRGWFHSSLLESCGTRGRAPYDAVLTHGFVLDEKGRKMSKSLGNVVAPQKVIADSGADILRLWVAASDYADDLRVGPEILKTFVELYRKLRNTLRWMLGTLAHHTPADDALIEQAGELEKLMLHRLVEMDAQIRAAYAAFDFKKVVALLTPFMTSDLSAFYFDIRKDALYCDPPSSLKRRTALAVIEQIFRCVTSWLAPILVFTAEEAWLARYPEAVSVHVESFPDVPSHWRDAALAHKWESVRAIRSVVTGALEIERAQKRIGSSLEAAPVVYVADPKLGATLDGVDFAEICIVSEILVESGEGPADAFRLPEIAGVAVVPARAPGAKCARSWKYFDPATADPAYPGVTHRDAQALRELRDLGRWSDAG
jgi:isoleucyl-tRNA synthetase